MAHWVTFGVKTVEKDCTTNRKRFSWRPLKKPFHCCLYKFYTPLKTACRIIILKPKSVENTLTKVPCYNSEFIKEKLEKNGWCYACNRTANKGDPGYCGAQMNTHENSTESHPKSVLGRWGVCDDICRENRYSLSIRSYRTIG